MKKVMIISLLITAILACFSINGYTQNHTKLCICFNSKTKYIDLNFSKDSAIVVFNIVREGFETKEKREEAKKEFYQNNNHPPMPISFYYTFIAINRPEKIISNNIDDCADKTTVEKYRQKEFEYPDGVGGSSVFLIQKLQDDTYLKWNASLMPKQ